MTSSKVPKSTTTTWLMGRPVTLCTVLMASVGPPYAKAALILSSPWPGMSTRRSRGMERSAIRCLSGSVCTIMIESERATDPCLDLEPLSAPSTRMLLGLESMIPSCGASARSARGSSFLFASLTPLRKARKPEHSPDERQDEQADEGPRDRADPAPPRSGGLRAAVLAGLGSVRLVLLRLAVGLRRLGPDRALYSPPAVDAVRLVLGRHATEYRSRSPWLPPV